MERFSQGRPMRGPKPHFAGLGPWRRRVDGIGYLTFYSILLTLVGAEFIYALGRPEGGWVAVLSLVFVAGQVALWNYLWHRPRVSPEGAIR